jgi:hypothetical protein
MGNREEQAMWTIIETATGEAASNGGDPALFDSYDEALAWADERIDRDDAPRFAIVDVDKL